MTPVLLESIQRLRLLSHSISKCRQTGQTTSLVEACKANDKGILVAYNHVFATDMAKEHGITSMSYRDSHIGEIRDRALFFDPFTVQCILQDAMNAIQRTQDELQALKNKLRELSV